MAAPRFANALPRTCSGFTGIEAHHEILELRFRRGSDRSRAGRRATPRTTEIVASPRVHCALPLGRATPFRAADNCAHPGNLRTRMPSDKTAQDRLQSVPHWLLFVAPAVRRHISPPIPA
jgi:hypothetical protein